MEDLTTEQKARAYDEAKYMMKEYLESDNAGVIAENTIRKAFPELAESDDERIRKELLQIAKKSEDSFYMVMTPDKRKHLITWLEKQEQKPADSYCQKNCKGFQETGKCFADGECKAKREAEQKTPWSEDDGEIVEALNDYVKNLDILFSEIKIGDKDILSKEFREKVQSWLNSIKDRVKPKQEILEKLEMWLDKYVSDLADVDTASLICSFKNYLDGKLPKSLRPRPRQEWSEEDERLFQIVIDILDRTNHLGNLSRTDLIACVRKLKSFRPQSQWKPSEEQLKSLKEVIDVGHFTSYPNALETLYEQLKKKS